MRNGKVQFLKEKQSFMQYREGCLRKETQIIVSLKSIKCRIKREGKRLRIGRKGQMRSGARYDNMK